VNEHKSLSALMRRRSVGAVPRVVLANGNYLNVVLIPTIEKNYGIIKSLCDALNEEKSDGIETSDIKEE
jgi:hypothetical protein